MISCQILNHAQILPLWLRFYMVFSLRYLPFWLFAISITCYFRCLIIPSPAISITSNFHSPQLPLNAIFNNCIILTYNCVFSITHISNYSQFSCLRILCLQLLLLAFFFTCIVSLLTSTYRFFFICSFLFSCKLRYLFFPLHTNFSVLSHMVARAAVIGRGISTGGYPQVRLTSVESCIAAL